jgi:hypothetical protein
MDEQFEALAAWVDGEPVARTDVALALETREGRDYVLDLMSLRHMVNVSTPSLVPAGAQREIRARRWPSLVAAAAAVVLCATAGFFAGRLVPPASIDSTDATVTPATTPASISAPAPTRVIRLEENTSWRESGGS